MLVLVLLRVPARLARAAFRCLTSGLTAAPANPKRSVLLHRQPVVWLGENGRGMEQRAVPVQLVREKPASRVRVIPTGGIVRSIVRQAETYGCLLYTSDAADE